MPLRVEVGLVDAVARSTGMVVVGIRPTEGGGTDARVALEAARRALYTIAHPEEPDAPLPSYSEVTGDGDDARLCFDIADAEAYDGLVAQVVEAVRSAAEAAGADGELFSAGEAADPSPPAAAVRFPQVPPDCSAVTLVNRSDDPGRGVTVAQLCAWLEGKRLVSEKPTTVSPVLLAFAESVAATAIETDTPTVLRGVAGLASRLVGSVGDAGLEQSRQDGLIGWLLHGLLPIWLDATGCSEVAAAMRSAPQVNLAAGTLPHRDALVAAVREVTVASKRLADHPSMAAVGFPDEWGRWLIDALFEATGARRHGLAGQEWLDVERHLEASGWSRPDSLVFQACTAVAQARWWEAQWAMGRTAMHRRAEAAHNHLYGRRDDQFIAVLGAAIGDSLSHRDEPGLWPRALHQLDTVPDWQAFTSTVAAIDQATLDRLLAAAGEAFTHEAANLRREVQATSLLIPAESTIVQCRYLVTVKTVTPGPHAEAKMREALTPIDAQTAASGLQVLRTLLDA